MGIRVRFICMFVLLFMAGSAVSIYVGHKVRMAEERLSGLERSVQIEISRIQGLEAEWAFLNNPVRLEKLAVEYLGMVMPEDVASVDADLLQRKNEIAVEHLIYQASYGVKRPQKRAPNAVAEKPILVSAERAQ